MPAHTNILFRNEAREKVLSGATKLADAVRVTLGPRSKSVLIQKQWGTPLVCNDGVTIAKQVNLKDPEENLGAQMLRQAAEKTGEAVGDGTSTSTILAHAIFADSVRNVVAGASAIDLKRGLDLGMALAVASLRAQSRPVSTRKEKAQVAAISAHNDPAVGELVADAMEKVGGEGVITVEESKTIETVLEVVEGMQFDRGYVSPYFATDADRMQAVLEDAYVGLTDRKLSVVKDLIPVLEQIAKTGKPILFVAEDIDGEALATLIVNQLRGVLRCVAVKAPGFGDRRKEMLEDMAVLTGGQVISEDIGVTLEHVELRQLGQVHRVVVDREHTTLIGGAGTRQAIEARMQQIQADRKSHQRLRQGKTAGTPGQAGRRRCGDQGRCADRSGDEGEEGCARRRDQRHQGRRCRRHRSRRRSCAAACRAGTAQAGGNFPGRRTHWPADTAPCAGGAGSHHRRQLRGR